MAVVLAMIATADFVEASGKRVPAGGGGSGEGASPKSYLDALRRPRGGARDVSAEQEVEIRRRAVQQHAQDRKTLEDQLGRARLTDRVRTIRLQAWDKRNTLPQYVDRVRRELARDKVRRELGPTLARSAIVARSLELRRQAREIELARLRGLGLSRKEKRDGMRAWDSVHKASDYQDTARDQLIRELHDAEERSAGACAVAAPAAAEPEAAEDTGALSEADEDGSGSAASAEVGVDEAASPPAVGPPPAEEDGEEDDEDETASREEGRGESEDAEQPSPSGSRLSSASAPTSVPAPTAAEEGVVDVSAALPMGSLLGGDPWQESPLAPPAWPPRGSGGMPEFSLGWPDAPARGPVPAEVAACWSRAPGTSDAGSAPFAGLGLPPVGLWGGASSSLLPEAAAVTCDPPGLLGSLGSLAWGVEDMRLGPLAAPSPLAEAVATNAPAEEDAGVGGLDVDLTAAASATPQNLAATPSFASPPYPVHPLPGYVGSNAWGCPPSVSAPPPAVCVRGPDGRWMPVVGDVFVPGFGIIQRMTGLPDTLPQFPDPRLMGGPAMGGHPCGWRRPMPHPGWMPPHARPPARPHARTPFVGASLAPDPWTLAPPSVALPAPAPKPLALAGLELVPQGTADELGGALPSPPPLDSEVARTVEALSAGAAGLPHAAGARAGEETT